jgi:hypothetical protein
VYVYSQIRYHLLLTLLASVKCNDQVKVAFGAMGLTWIIPRRLLRLSSGHMRTKFDLEEGFALEQHQRAAVFGVFRQWLWTGKYTGEQDEVAELIEPRYEMIALPRLQEVK